MSSCASATWRSASVSARRRCGRRSGGWSRRAWSSATTTAGSWWSRPDEGSTEENFQIRAALESLGASLAAAKIDEAGVKRLEELNAQMQAAGEWENARYAELNREFHLTVYEYAHSPLLMSLMRLLWALAASAVRSGDAHRYVRNRCAGRGSPGRADQVRPGLPDPDPGRRPWPTGTSWGRRHLPGPDRDPHPRDLGRRPGRGVPLAERPGAARADRRPGGGGAVDHAAAQPAWRRS